MDLTNDIYWAHQDPKVRVLRTIPDPLPREAKAEELDGEGFIIDRYIMISGGDAAAVMGARAQLGMRWVPNAFQPNIVYPEAGGFPADYNPIKNPWPRSVTVSIDAADYPPFEQLPPPLPVLKPVGAQNGNLFAANMAAVNDHGRWLFYDGQSYVQDGVKYIFHLMFTPWGPEAHWTAA